MKNETSGHPAKPHTHSCPLQLPLQYIQETPYSSDHTSEPLILNYISSLSFWKNFITVFVYFISLPFLWFPWSCFCPFQSVLKWIEAASFPKMLNLTFFSIKKNKKTSFYPTIILLTIVMIKKMERDWRIHNSSIWKDKASKTLEWLKSMNGQKRRSWKGGFFFSQFLT